ncbi:MAG: PEP-CTERM sorting domain-containing protein [Phycisphaerales bacterium JB041]
MKITAIAALAGAACAANAQVGAAVSANAANDNFTSETITVDPGYDGNAMLETWGAGDMFGITSRPDASGTPNGLPFAIADDSLFGFPGDSQGIVDENDNCRFFGVVDSVNGSNPGNGGTAVWTFDITGAGALSINIDFAAMGDFEAADVHLFEVDIDGGGFTTLFEASINESGSQDYTMADGGVYTVDDPMSMNGTLLNNNFQPPSAAVAGSGSTLTLRYAGTSDGGTEAFAFRNIVVVPTPGALALIGLGGLTAIRRRR